MIQTRVGDVTFTEFMELIHEDQKADLIDGVIYMASPENIEHNDLVSWLLVVIRGFMDHRRLGKVTVNRVAYRLGRRNAPEPDIGVVLAERSDRIRRGYIEGPPDLAIEIVSPESVHRDYELKRRRYEEAGVREYWIIDPDEKSATFLSLEDGRFVEILPERHIFRSRILKGLAVDVRWFWETPLPDVFPILQSIVSKKPRRT